MSITPTQSNVQAAVRALILAVLPGIEVIAAVDNRSAEPTTDRFVVVMPAGIRRLSTNVDGSADVRYIGTVSGTLLTVTEVTLGTILIDAFLLGTGVLSGTSIIAQISGAPGGDGTYRLSQANPILASRVLASGTKTLTQSAEVRVQLDFHTADNTAADIAQTVSTAFRDEFATSFLAALAPPLNGVSPLHADDPRYVPFINEAQQVEWRWVLDAFLQVEQIVVIPQQYADSVSVILKSVDAVAPP
jgi:hypothetical protein